MDAEAQFPLTDFPQCSTSLAASANAFHSFLSAFKASVPPPNSGWYPFDSLTATPLLADLLSGHYDDVAKDAKSAPLLDLGCADGDLSLLFASWGISVDAVDSARNNFNRLEGVKTLAAYSGLNVQVHDIDLDARFDFPGERYGLALFLGTLYHLKNPYYLLEQLAFKTSWCLLSTRIASSTPRSGALIDLEPVAYLADGREINNDATNYWIFSFAGLLRIVQRTRWAVCDWVRVGCLQDSNPIDPERDERAFLLLKSRVFYPELSVRKGDGWHLPENHGWCWTHKQFSMIVILPLEQNFTGFKFQFFVPQAIVDCGTLRVTSFIAGTHVGEIEVGNQGMVEFTGHLPPFALHEPILTIKFLVTHKFNGDNRELGVFVPFSETAGQQPVGMPFQLLR